MFDRARQIIGYANKEEERARSMPFCPRSMSKCRESVRGCAS
jgi:hypothetical protein